MSDALIDSLEKEHLVTVVRQFQRSTSSGGAASWQNYLDSQKLKRNDPSLCSIAQLRQFIKQALASPSSASSELQHADVMNRFVRWVGWKRDVQKAEDGAKEAISSSEGAWGLVKRTRAHHSYAKNYDLQSHMKGWAWIRKRALSEEKPRLIAMDCEMVETDVDMDSLVGFCLVDEQGKVIMKSLVKPKGTIVNYRKALTGLSEEDLDHVTLTREEARKQVKAVLQQDGGCILCGHAVHNDLRALRLHHPDVIDTSFIFQYRDLPLCSPALKDLAKIILGLDIRLGDDAHHDSYEDSFVTMKLIQHELAKGPTPLLMPPDVQVPKEDLKKLFVHRLPPGTKEQDILSFFRHGPFESIEGDLASRKAFLVFKTPEDANSSFKLLNGTDTHQTDNLGRAQKEVRMALNKSFLVRKMASHNGRLFGKDRTGMRELLARSQKQGAVAKSQKQSPKANHLGSRKRKAEPAADKIEGKSPVRARKAKRPRGNKDKATDKA